MQESVSFTEPKLYDYKGDLSKKWFVYYEVYNGEKQIRKQIRSVINFGTTTEERKKLAKKVIALLKEQLKEEHKIVVVKSEAEKLASMTFKKALEFALKECKPAVASKTYAGYALTKKYFLAVADEIADIEITRIKKLHIKLLLQRGQEKYTWSNKRYNKIYEYLRGILSRLVDWEIIEHNPASKIKLLPVAETQKFIPYTIDEKKTIADHLFINHYRFYVFLLFVYHKGVRPKEVLALKIKDIDFTGNLITIMPDLAEENSKTKTIRRIPLSHELLPFIRELNLSEYDKEMYVFGSPYESGQGNRGSAKGQRTGAFHPDYFKPSFTRIKRDTVTKFWNKIVKKNLGIDKYLYAAKHTGGDDKILAGMDIDALKELYGHSSKYMTEKYVSQLKEIYRKHIIEHSPSFV